MNAVAYLRVSGKGQLAGDGFSRQFDAVSRFAAAHALEVEHVYREEAIPGKTDENERPAFQQMVADLLANGCRTVLVERLDRLARLYRMQEQLIFYLASKRIEIISCDTGENVTQAMMGDPMKAALVQMQGIFSELEKKMLVAKLARARKRIRERTGKCEGPKWFGELPGESETLAFILRLAQDGLNGAEITRRLNQEGYRPRSAQRWHQVSVDKIVARHTGGELCRTI